MGDVYLDYGGWLKLDSETRMQYIGEDESCEQVITVAVWRTLSEELRNEYILDDSVAAVRDAEDMEFNELTITEAEIVE